MAGSSRAHKRHVQRKYYQEQEQEQVTWDPIINNKSSIQSNKI